MLRTKLLVSMGSRPCACSPLFPHARSSAYRYAEERACGKRGEHAHGLDPMETNSFVLSTPHYSCMDTGCSLGMASQ